MNVYTASLNVNVSLLLEMLHRGSVTWQCDRDRERENANDYKQNSLPSQSSTANIFAFFINRGAIST
jgi:hypothetical protein